jgi:hypothetical protein|tara:strand:+ start:1050 stop:1262 length:213 start_codon:yes stop_codon:yes gene_type:complete
LFIKIFFIRIQNHLNLLKIDLNKKRDEKNICVVSHSSFIGDLKDGFIGDEEHELKHCFPYKYNIIFQEIK